MSNYNSDSKAIKGYGAMLPMSKCDEVMKKDYDSLSTLGLDNFLSRNKNTYYLAINSWLLLVKEIVPEPHKDKAIFTLSQLVLDQGLVNTITMLQEIADLVIKGCTTYQTEIPSFQELAMDAKARLRLSTLTVLSAIDDQSQLLQVLRYLKRFAPYGSDKLNANALDKFYAVNRKCRELNRENGCYWLETRIANKLSTMLSSFPKHLDTEFLSFSSGTSQVGKTLDRKLNGYAHIMPHWYDMMYPLLSTKPPVSQYSRLRYNKQTLKPHYAVTPTAVPKSYKTSRIIAPEHPYCIAQLQKVRKAAEASLANSNFGILFDPSDQDTNREIAFLGSVTGDWATIDMSSASDSISRSLAFRILPKSYTDSIYPYLANFLVKENQLVGCSMFATSGNPITFITEGMIFLAIFLVARDLHHEFTGSWTDLPRVFGDDGIVPIQIFDLCGELLEKCGFVINWDKSFANGTFYRESCGVEYLQGIPMRTIYFPRSQFDWRDVDGCVAKMVDLQHRLFDYWSVSTFLTTCVRSLYADMTSSAPCSDCTDLWEEIPKFTFKPDTHIVFKRRSSKDFVYPEFSYREFHWALVAENKRRKTDIDPNVEMSHYVDYLLFGPRYDSPLDELLHVSTSRCSDHDYYTPKMLYNNSQKLV